MLKDLKYLFARLTGLLAWIGRQGARAIAALVFIGVAFPALGEWLKPFVAAAIFLLLCISFMRVDVAALRDLLRRPALIVAATAWTMLGVPLVTGTIGLAIGLDRMSPDLFVALVLQSVASPMMAAPALAGLMGLDATLVLVTLVTGTALVPFTAPLFANIFLGDLLSLRPRDFGVQLLAILGGSLIAAIVIRRFVDADAMKRHKLQIDGFNVLVLLVFVSAVMSGVAGAALADPLRTVALLALAFAVFAALLASTMLIFRSAGSDRAFALGLMVCQRNMGLMIAAAAGALSALGWVYFALSQFPIYLSPQLLGRLARRMKSSQD